jgi:hypothetical protein
VSLYSLRRERRENEDSVSYHDVACTGASRLKDSGRLALGERRVDVVDPVHRPLPLFPSCAGATESSCGPARASLPHMAEISKGPVLILPGGGCFGDEEAASSGGAARGRQAAGLRATVEGWRPLAWPAVCRCPGGLGRLAAGGRPTSTFSDQHRSHASTQDSIYSVLVPESTRHLTCNLSSL